ncbi:hypothetical protein [Armatimonas rosea]|uniref:PEP-CTERM protein-sorting domain-containing protein n=1 Tax=Armatimonas rosea TaxID=685828 RepID=A0A7W9SUA3_ARMRO|nr:hypothetical protein [Armatimonas rosea]MBB6052168.1 hypothetical protein [Armatimonas rosea]
MNAYTRSLLALLLIAFCRYDALAQVLFRDDFNRAALTVGAPTTYTTTVTSGDGDASIVGGSFLQLTNDGTAAANASGRVWVAGQTMSFSGFSPTLSSNAGALSWSFNARYNRTTNPGGFDANLYSMAVILGATSSDLTTANGYAIAYGNAGAPDPIRLVRFTGGLDADANLTTLISSGASDLAAVNDYFSVRVLYNPNTNDWQLLVRDDGTSAWGDPQTVSTSVGTAFDTAYTATPLTHFGFLWNYNTATNQTVQFDNFQLATVPEPSTGMLVVVGLAMILAWRQERVGRRPRA